ncbi:hypothetical protein [Niveispirillum sp. KHB5.9]|uniref:DUF7210 family protein n=1 Tax=Niveispirillum sp. KHB5.9 TaxID=3400269 RepID=UPI003A8BC033
MPRAIVLTPLRHDGRRYQPGDTVELSTAAATRLAATGTISDIMPDEAVPVGVVAPGPSDLGLALDLVADVFGFDSVQELCTTLEAYIEFRNSRGAAGIHTAPAAAGKPQGEGAEASRQDAPGAKTGPVTGADGDDPAGGKQDAPDAGAAAPASATTPRKVAAKKAGA